MAKRKRSTKRKKTETKADTEQVLDEIKSLKEELEKKDNLIKEYTNLLKRLQADLENMRKKMEQEKEEYIKYANEKLILNLLDIYENLERAVKTSKKPGSEPAIVDGVQMIYDQLHTLLEKEGLAWIPTVGEKFDPFKHEAVLTEEIEGVKEGVVLEELQRGYMLNNRVIRPAKVKVSK